MTKQVSLADSSYARLKAAKRPGESFSNVVDRLLAGQDKDPWLFIHNAPRHPRPALERLARIQAERAASEQDA